MNKKLSIFAVAFASLFVTVEANATEAEVLDVSPNYIYQTTYETETRYEKQCNIARSNDRGWIERGTNSTFGSLEGTIGTAVGYGIGNEIGGGSGREITRVLGAILGNKIGNDISDRKAIQRGQTECYNVPVTERFPVKNQVLTHYNVVVLVEGNQYVVERSFAPRIGSYIDVSLRVK